LLRQSCLYAFLADELFFNEQLAQLFADLIIFDDIERDEHPMRLFRGVHQEEKQSAVFRHVAHGLITQRSMILEADNAFLDRRPCQNGFNGGVASERDALEANRHLEVNVLYLGKRNKRVGSRARGTELQKGCGRIDAYHLADLALSVAVHDSSQRRQLSHHVVGFRNTLIVRRNWPVCHSRSRLVQEVAIQGEWSFLMSGSFCSRSGRQFHYNGRCSATAAWESHDKNNCYRFIVGGIAASWQSVNLASHN
jgi:hypothetical protein